MNSTPIDRNLAIRNNTDMIDNLKHPHDDEQRLEQAFDWLCMRRKTAPDNADIWDLRFHWATRKPQLLRELQTGSYQLKPMQIVGKDRHVMWSAENALVLKWLALDLANTLPLHSHCEHIKGHGGGKASIQQRHDDITQIGYRWVCRTDIKGYYQHINKTTLFRQLQQHVTRPAYLNLLSQYLHYSVEDGGEFFTPESGIARGCALSPLMGAFHLWALDNHFAHQKKIAYARYMDDFVILAHTRWSLRKQVKRLNQFFNEYGFKQHPDKTFIGKVEKGFDWLGGQFGVNGLEGVSPRSIANHLERLRQFYERTRYWTKEKRQARVVNYRKRWKMWFAVTIGMWIHLPASICMPSFTMGPGQSATQSVSLAGTSPLNYAAPPVAANPGAVIYTNLCVSALPGALPGGVCPYDILISNGAALWGGGPAIPVGKMYLQLAPEPIWIEIPSDFGFRWVADIANSNPGMCVGAGDSIFTWNGPVGYSTQAGILNFLTGTSGTVSTIGMRNDRGVLTYLCNFTARGVGDGSFTVHVSPAANMGTYTIPALYLRHYMGYSEFAGDPGTVLVQSQCIVNSTSQTLDFGKVSSHLGSGTSLGVVKFTPEVRCSAGKNTNKATYSVNSTSGTVSGTSNKLLSMVQGAGSTVRGGVVFLDSGSAHLAGSTCTSGYGLPWDGADRPLKHDGAGKWWEELSFVLCSSGVGGGGVANASAVVTYKWN